MKPFFRTFLIPVAGLLLAVVAAIVLGPVGASGSPAPAQPAAVVDTVETTTTTTTTTTTVAPTTTTAAPPAVKPLASAKPQPAKAKAPLQTTTTAPAAVSNDGVEIGTACVMERTAGGAITSTGC